MVAVSFYSADWMLQCEALPPVVEPRALTVLHRPTLPSLVESTRHALTQHQCIVLVGTCQVEYKGRARSSLAGGERVVLIKTDGSVLVHRPVGYEPVNWQPPGGHFRTKLDNGALTIDAVRREPNESLSIRFVDVAVFIAAKLSDMADFSLHVSEKEMQQAIVAEPKLLLADLKLISYEKQVEPGFIDIYGLDSNGKLVVAELKRVNAGKAAAIQLSKYVEYVKTQTQKEIRGILVAPGLLKGVQKLLATLGLEFVQIDLERCSRVISSRKERKIVDFFT